MPPTSCICSPIDSAMLAAPSSVGVQLEKSAGFFIGAANSLSFTLWLCRHRRPFLIGAAIHAVSILMRLQTVQSHKARLYDNAENNFNLL